MFDDDDVVPGSECGGSWVEMSSSSGLFVCLLVLVGCSDGWRVFGSWKHLTCRLFCTFGWSSFGPLNLVLSLIVTPQ